MGLSSLEICAGAGGQAFGIEQSGFEHVSLVEIEPAACQTLRINRTHWHVIEGNLRYITQPKNGEASSFWPVACLARLSQKQASNLVTEEPKVRDERIAGDGVDLHVVTAGTGPPVILLHGFPESWRSWQWQIPELVAAGFSVLAPDMRGYNLSDRPADQSAYRLDHLVADVAALVKATGYRRAHIVGHDWGGVVAWAFAERHPELVDKLVILNAPHMKIYLKKVKYPRQMLKSWYMLFFQLPRMPELALSANNFRAVRKMFRSGPANKEAFSNQDIEEYVEGLSKPGALTAALNYYRANLTLSSARRFANWKPIDAETLVIWGELDPALGRELLDRLHEMVPRVHIHRIPHSSHWVQNEAPEEVNRVLLRFLKGQQLN